MKAKTLFFSVLLIVSGLLLPALPSLTEPAVADGQPSCPDIQCGTSLEINVVDQDGGDASGRVNNITWQRTQPATCSNCGPNGLAVNNGSLVADGTHYHSSSLLYVQLNDNNTQCDQGNRNQIQFIVNGVPVGETVNICRDWQSSGVLGTLTLPEQPPGGGGTAEIIINDVNGIFESIYNAAFLQCTVTNQDTSQSYSCPELLAEDDPSAPRAVISGGTLVLLNLPPGPYRIVISFGPDCGFCGAGLDLPAFREALADFSTSASQTTSVVIDVMGYIHLSEDGNMGIVPPAPEDPELPCIENGLNNALEWIVCPVVFALFNVIDVFYKAFIIPLLQIDPLDSSATPGTPERTIFGIWNGFRVVANIAFVIIFLIAILGQGLSGFSAFTAYDIRKIAPRLVIGIIGVQLSWYLIAFMVDVFNLVGAGVRGLILAPVDGLTLDGDFNFSSAWQELALIIGIIGTAAIALWVGGLLMGLPLVLFPIIFGLLLAFITLLARRILVLVLVVTAPIAFVAWILPNTANIFQKWWEYFWKALIVYPLIILLISSGELFAKIIWASNTAPTGEQEGAATSLIAMVALFAPYFLIPLTFRFAGSAISEVANGLDRRGKNLNQRFFGTTRDPRSWRGRRRAKQVNARARNKSYISDRAKKAASYKSDKEATSRLARMRGATIRGSGRLAGRANATLGGGSADRNAEQLAQARRKGSEQTGSARDFNIYARLGPYNLQTGGRLSQEAVAGAAGEANSLHDKQYALDYYLSKANDDEDVIQIYNRFMHGCHGEECANDNNTPGGINKNKYSPGLTQDQKEAMFSRAADKMQIFMGDYKYRDPNKLDANGRPQLTQDISRLRRFSNEVVHRNSARSRLRDVGKQREQYWDGIGEMGQRAQQVAVAAGGRFNSDGTFDGSGYDDSRLSHDEREFMRNMALIRDGSRDEQASGGAASANRARRSAMNSLSWLDDKEIKRQAGI